jgi:hypothetical protein
MKAFPITDRLTKSPISNASTKFTTPIRENNTKIPFISLGSPIKSSRASNEISSIKADYLIRNKFPVSPKGLINTIKANDYHNGYCLTEEDTHQTSKIINLDLKWKRDDIMNRLLAKDKRPVTGSKLSNFVKSNVSFKDHIKNKETIMIMKRRFDK